MSLSAAIRDAAIPAAELDARGLLPLEHARACLAETIAVERDNLDRVWLALLSLEDGAELARASAHLRWDMPPRGKENVALVERYGDGALAWIAERAVHGVLFNHPWCVLPCLHALTTPAALALLLSVDGVQADGGTMTAWVHEPAAPTEDLPALAEAATAQALAWSRRNLDVAIPALAAAAPTNPRAADVLRALARQAPGDVAARMAAAGATELAAALALPTALDVDTIVDELAAAALRSWPVFVVGYDGRVEYFAQRVIGVRARQGDGWAVVFERLQGSDADMFMIARYAYGPAAVGGFDYDHSDTIEIELAFDGDAEDDGGIYAGATMTGPAGALRLDESIFAQFDLRPEVLVECGGNPPRTMAIRAYLAAHPGGLWPPVEDALAAAGLDDAEIVSVSDSYQHPAPWHGEGESPWPTDVAAAPSIRSLVEAVIAREPSRFVPGPSNLDWRLHAADQHGGPPPWTTYSFAVEDRWVAAAMKVAAVEVDERGLVPIEEARVIVANATSLARGDGARRGDAWVWDGDRAWAALLSLADGAEAAAAFARLGPGAAPRDAARNRALVERYGDDAAAIVRALARPDGVIVGSPLARATVLALGTAAGFRLVWDVTGWDEPGGDGSPDDQAGALFAAWVAAHPAVGYAELGRMVAAGDTAAGAFLTAWAAPQVRRVHRWLCDGLGRETADLVYARLGMSAVLAPAHILAALDHAAARGGDGWPRFVTGVGPSREYHGLRLLGARVGDDWLVVIERFEGYGRSLAVARYTYGDRVDEGLTPRLARPIALPDGLEVRNDDARLIEPPDYWTRYDRPQRAIAAARALVRTTPDAVWAPAAEVMAAVGAADAVVLVDAIAFAHTDGDPLPSATATYRALAEALAAGDAGRFVAGDTNLDVDRHVTGPIVPAPADVAEEEDEDAENEDADETASS